MAKPGMVLVKGKGGGIGRLRNTPETSDRQSDHHSHTRAIEKDAETRSDHLLHFLVNRAPEMDHPLQHRKGDADRLKINFGSQGRCPKAMRSPERAMASPKGIEIPGMETGNRKGRQRRITTNCSPRPWRILTISRMVNDWPLASRNSRRSASEIRSVAAAESVTSRMRQAINHA